MARILPLFRRIHLIAGLLGLAGFLIIGVSLPLKSTVAAPPAPDRGWMTGGGSVFQEDSRVTHGFTLQCDATDGPNNLQVNWNGNRFHLEDLSSAVCSDDPSIDPRPPVANFDTYQGAGTGRYNGVSGATAQWNFTDAGEPGRNDLAQIVITNAGGNIVLWVAGNLHNGNHQAHGSAAAPPGPPPTATPISPTPPPGQPTPTGGPLPSGVAPQPSPTAPLLVGLPSAGIGGLTAGGGGSLSPWLLVGVSLATSGATLSLGAQLARLRRARRLATGSDRVLPSGRPLLVQISPVADFYALVDTVRALAQTPGIGRARALRLGQTEGFFEVMLSRSTTGEALAQAVSETLGRAVHIEPEAADAAEDEASAA